MSRRQWSAAHKQWVTVPDDQPDLDHALLLGRVAVITNQQTTHASWAVRGQQVQAVLHEAGVHTGDLDDAGRPVRSDWRACPRCCMHPERYAEVKP